MELAPTGIYRESEFPPTEALYKRSSACEAFHRLGPFASAPTEKYVHDYIFGKSGTSSYRLHVSA